MKLFVKMCLRCRVNFWADRRLRVCNPCKAQNRTKRSQNEHGSVREW